MTVTPDEAARLEQLFHQLDCFTDQSLQLGTGIKKDSPGSFSEQTRWEIRLARDQHPQVMETYLSQNPDQLGPVDLELVSSWKGRVVEDYFLVKHLKTGSIFMSSKTGYKVLALNRTFEEVSFHQSLPLMLQARLLPFGDRIVYDGGLMVRPIHFGPGARRNILADYSEARAHGRIKSSFLEVVAPPPPPPRADPGHLGKVAEIARQCEKLRGGNDVQKAALTMLRWSAQLAENVLQDSTDHLELSKQLSQIRKADTQLIRALRKRL